MSSNEYSSVPSTGKLKLKGVKDAKVDKKKKKKKQRSEEFETASGFTDHSVVLQKLEDEDASIAKDRPKMSPAEDETDDLDEKSHEPVKTEAERRYEEQRRKRLDERLRREGVKTHKERVEALNKYLSNLSEHHDMPRIGPG